MERAIQEIRDATEIVKTWEAEIDALSDTTGIYRLHSTNVVSQVLPFGATFLPNHSRCKQLPGIRTVTVAARVTHRSPLGFVRGPADIERQRCGCVPRTWPRIWSRLGLAQYGLTAIAPGANPSGSDAIGVKLPVAPMLYADTPFPTVVDPT